jgi:hypothetical protein
MRPDALEALDRTARLLNMDLFNGELTLDSIVDGLVATRARVEIGLDDAATVGGQHALVTLCLHLAMNGIGIDLATPEVPLLSPQPPLAGADLHQAIVSHISTIWPWVDLQPGASDVVFAIGRSARDDAIVVSADAEACRVGPARLIKPLSFVG